MNQEVEQLINQAVSNIIERSSSKQKIDSLLKRHNAKIHFIPSRYRVFGGLLQSMNIQFGNFIEELMAVLIKNDERYQIIDTYSGKKQNTFSLSSSNDRKIDEYITKCQTIPNFDINTEFTNLLNSIMQDNDEHINTFKHDIDLLFQNKKTGQTYYVEIKYNDDHDTGKFVDINRKIIKTYAYLTKTFDVKTTNDLIPILFFFTNKRLKGNIYIPEVTNIKRGKQFFEEFLSIDYNQVDEYLKNLSESSEIVEMFNNLYKRIMEISK